MVGGKHSEGQHLKPLNSDRKVTRCSSSTFSQSSSPCHTSSCTRLERQQSHFRAICKRYLQLATCYKKPTCVLSFGSRAEDSGELTCECLMQYLEQHENGLMQIAESLRMSGTGAQSVKSVDQPQPPLEEYCNCRLRCLHHAKKTSDSVLAPARHG